MELTEARKSAMVEAFQKCIAEYGIPGRICERNIIVREIWDMAQESVLAEVENTWIPQGTDSGGHPLTQSGKLWADAVRLKKTAV